LPLDEKGRGGEMKYKVRCWNRRDGEWSDFLTTEEMGLEKALAFCEGFLKENPDLDHTDLGLYHRNPGAYNTMDSHRGCPSYCTKCLQKKGGKLSI